jgi:hypothetical protein
MADGLERRPNRSPASALSRDSSEPTPKLFSEVIIDGQPVQIYSIRKQLSLEIAARIPDGNQPGETIGTATAEQIVVNSQNLRLLSIGGFTEIGHALLQNLFEFARKNGLNVLPSERMDEATRQWLTDNGLPDSYINPDI